ncbi:hypothetical protein B0T22DRAFT_482365 [Podospora appendiculata]|uniref:Uncharacterized protein n=1 Tax=Podospora appendiculata TaxID=314037 RepID=A0AAE0X5M1_9PEZI|nr:hypothetical protein B0T22DRAFT_482365 [Podospora appendiculata]
MPGLASSRHAPSRPATTTTHRRQPSPLRRSGSLPPPLTVTPAPTGDGNAHRLPPAPGPSSASSANVARHTHNAPAAVSAARAHATSELIRYTKILRRLQWKLPFLAAGYQQAVARVDGQDAARVAEAELMFKLDFFEYYMLVERALVHLMGVFSITISRDGGGSSSRHHAQQHPPTSNGLATSKWNANGAARNGDPGSGSGSGAQHRYHANVLEALDNKENPLHSVLGTGEVRRQLGRAKDLRNRWKTAADGEDNEPSSSSSAKPQPGNGSFSPANLESYDLEGILSSVFEGFNAAFAIAERFVVRYDHTDDEEGSVIPDTDMAEPEEERRIFDWAASEEEQWGFMVDAMDWEAV